MRVKSNKIAIAMLTCLPAIALADNGWTGKGEFGLVMASGNTENESINASLEFGYTVGKWTQSLAATLLRAEDADNEIANRYTLSADTKYAWTEISYGFLALRHDKDKFGGYDYQSSLAAGYGHKFLDNDIHKLSVELGAGVARFKENLSEQKNEANIIGFHNTIPAGEETYPIIRGGLDYAWKLTDSTEFTENFLVESGSENTLLENKLGLSVAINKNLALKLGYEVKHNTEVSHDGIDKTDTLLTTNLVYNFTP